MITNPIDNEKWTSIDFEPLDELLEVQDKDGNTSFAYPTIYPFRFGKDGKIIHCDPYWDGGWLIEVSDFDIYRIGTPIFWREILKNKL